MFQNLLIANRGEIACRIIRTARRMGLRSIAVFSDADETAQH
ncbi:MAG: biotin carboxylase N-terminal domain-containing protein, partial [Alphaproteobacteria bacterium]